METRRICPKVVLLLAMTLIVEGCSATRSMFDPVDTEEAVASLALPETYGQPDGDGNLAEIEWRDFFRSEPLVQLIDHALRNNQELAILLEEIEIARNEARSTSGEYLPFVRVRGGAGVRKVGEFTHRGAVEEELELREDRGFDTYQPEYGVAAEISWEVDIWKKLQNANKAAALRYLATAEGRRFMVTRLVAEIASSYYELVAVSERQRLLQQMLDVQEDALAAVRLQKEAGETTELAVRRFEAEVRKNRSELALVRQAAVESENRLNVLAGRYPQPIERDPSLLESTPDDPSRFGSPRDLLANRPDIRRAELELAASRFDVKVARARFYPKLDLSAAVGFESLIGSLLFSTPESLIVGVAGDLTAPLFNRRAIQATFDSANAAQRRALLEYQRTVLRAYVEVVNRLALIRNIADSLLLKQMQVASLDSSVEVAGRLFRSARADYTEVLLTQRDALESRLELVELQQRQLVASVETYVSLGGASSAKPHVE